MTTIGYINVTMELMGAVMLLVILICILLMREAGVNRQTKLFLSMLMVTILLLICDAMAWIFKGRVDTVAFYMVRICNFIVYCMGYMQMALIADYLIEHISIQKRALQLVRKSMWWACAVAIGFVVLSQFNHMYYYIDAQNIYHRQELFWLSQTYGIAAMIVTLSLTIRYHRQLGRRDTFFFLVYIGLPILALILQIFIYGLAILNVATTLAIFANYIGIQAEQAQRIKGNELELAEQRIAVMLSQIQPHFLYNALTAINELCAQDAKEAQAAVIAFSRYLRHNLDSVTLRDPIPFKKEMEHVENYLSLEKRRFGERLKVEIDIQTDAFMLPALTVQPIVENAIQYGTMRREKGGKVLIRTEEGKEEWRVIIADDGVGFNPQEQTAKDGRSHLGIANVRSRLKSLCEGDLIVKSALGEGTTVVLSIPKTSQKS